MDPDDLLEKAADGELTQEELESQEGIDSVEKLTQEEARARLKAAAKRDPALDVISVNHPEMAPAVFKAASIAQDESERLLREYGAPTAVLEIPEKAEPEPDDVESVYQEIREELLGDQLLLKNDEYIADYRARLENAGFSFVDDWHEEDSDYRKLLRLAEEHGVTYKMSLQSEGWTYTEIEG